MQMQITARHFKLKDDLRRYTEDRVGKLERYYDGITTVHVILDIEQGNAEENKRTAEIALGVYRQTLTAQEAAETHEEAVNKCVSTMKRQLLRYKDKLRGKHKYKPVKDVVPIEAEEVIPDEAADLP